MIRIMVKEQDANAAIHVGGDMEIAYKTFEINCPELEAYLGQETTYCSRRVVGAEIAFPTELTPA